MNKELDTDVNMNEQITFDENASNESLLLKMLPDDIIGEIFRNIPFGVDWKITKLVCKKFMYFGNKIFDPTIEDYERINWAIYGRKLDVLRFALKDHRVSNNKIRGDMYRCLEMNQEAIDAYTIHLNSNKDDSIVLNNRGLVFGFIGKFEEALNDLNQSESLRPDDAIIIANRGDLKREMKQYEEALIDFNKSLTLFPKNETVLNNRGLTHKELGNLDQALKDFDDSLQLNANDPITLGNRGLTYGAMGRLADALADFNKAIEIDPKKRNSIGNRADTLYYLGKLEEAYQDYQTALELPPSPTEVKSNDASIRSNFCNLLIQMERIDEAICNINKCLEIEEDPMDYAKRAIMYSIKGDEKKAREDLKRSEKISIGVWEDKDYFYGRVEYCLGNLSQAHKYFANSLATNSTILNAVTFYWQGMTLWKMNRKEEALKIIDDALKFIPERYLWKSSKESLLKEIERKEC